MPRPPASAFAIPSSPSESHTNTKINMAQAEVASRPVDETARWTYLDTIRKNPGPFTDPIAGTQEAIDQFDKIKVFGAGGLGCEILKNLAMSKFKDIHVIDMDIIDISNLNRQFLFRKSDVGKYKADVAAKFVMKRVKGVKITAHSCRIQDFDNDFYKQFQFVICGLDSIEARRWINAMLVSIAEEGEDADCLIPMIDGGTEGFKGQARVIVPSITSCIECQLDMHAPRAAVPLCTIASIPRQPEHCIEWAHVIAWEKERPFPQLDKDDPEHITWLYQKALARANEFNITDVNRLDGEGRDFGDEDATERIGDGGVDTNEGEG
ncbi:hypothetical protein BN1723_013884 [Verticillium longisporum]|uniref:NEDD8-activating enzyme E1 catalytic subunit n=1 Tax=Verticillium longisporum TaxID=100787 RepID=A0A0G4LXF7_VERLO|nr:hypothetical protein BN1723_013884 [Verticillium longisporum]